jgi:hypothetical protein
MKRLESEVSAVPLVYGKKEPAPNSEKDEATTPRLDYRTMTVTEVSREHDDED